MVARKTLKERNEEQRLRQSQMRKTAKELRRPNRDDLARMLLWQMVTLAQKADGSNKQQALDGLCNKIVGGLVRQGFDEGQSEEVFDTLAKRYASGLPPFRVKRHLQNNTPASE